MSECFGKQPVGTVVDLRNVGKMLLEQLVGSVDGMLMFQLIGYVWEGLCGDGVIWLEATLEELYFIRVW